jgi:phosphinothricin acetyltransferase
MGIDLRNDTIIYRQAEAGDIPAINRIYNFYVEETPITFDLSPTSDQERSVWFEQFKQAGPYQLIVAEGVGGLLGYAGTVQFRQKPAYSTSVETTIYVAQDAQGLGIGRGLYRQLFQALKGQGVHRLYAGITLPNEKSVVLHQKMGFSYIGTFHEVGRKFDRFWDVGWYEKDFE